MKTTTKTYATKTYATDEALELLENFIDTLMKAREPLAAELAKKREELKDSYEAQARGTLFEIKWKNSFTWEMFTEVINHVSRFIDIRENKHTAQGFLRSIGKIGIYESIGDTVIERADMIKFLELTRVHYVYNLSDRVLAASLSGYELIEDEKYLKAARAFYRRDAFSEVMMFMSRMKPPK